MWAHLDPATCATVNYVASCRKRRAPRRPAGSSRNRTTTSLAPNELAELLGHRSRPLDCLDIGLAEQLAVTEACDLFLAPHTGFGMAALAVDTPWLALSGGRWFEYFFNRVPFRSIIPDCGRYPSFTQFAPTVVIDDDGDGPRTPSMTASRIHDDLNQIVAAARELLDGSLTYEQSLRDYFPVAGGPRRRREHNLVGRWCAPRVFASGVGVRGEAWI